MRHRRGDVRSDGKVFLGTSKTRGKNYERWVTPEKLLQIKQAQKAYRNDRYEAYKKSVGKRPKLGQVHPETGLLFITVTSNGKEIWGNSEELQKYRERLAVRCNKHYHKKYHSSHPAKVCVGDQHPTDTTLVVVRAGRMCVKYGTQDELQRLREKDREKSRLYREKHKDRFAEKYRKNKSMLEMQPHLKRSRGDIDPVTGLLFWGYAGSCIERWLTREKFHELKARIKKRYISRKKAKNSP